MKTPPVMTLEKEWKYLFEGPGDCAALRSLLGPPERVERQRNSYWIPAAPVGAVLRLRESDSGFVLCLKLRGRRTGALVERQETELPLDPQQARDFLAGDPALVATLLARIGATAPLEEAGQLENHREIWIKAGFEIALDQSFFPEGPAFEVEFEECSIDARPDFPLAVLKLCGVPERPAEMGKFSRLQLQLGKKKGRHA